MMKALAVAWFREDDWLRWCAIDPDFQPDYEHWRRRAESAFQQQEAMGHRVVKITLDLDEFIEWSRANGGQIDTQARATFAAVKLRWGAENPVDCVVDEVLVLGDEAQVWLRPLALPNERLLMKISEHLAQRNRILRSGAVRVSLLSSAVQPLPE